MTSQLCTFSSNDLLSFDPCLSSHLSYRNTEGVCLQHNILRSVDDRLTQTRMMSSTGESKRSLNEAMRHLWQMGGLRAYYRGLTVGLTVTHEREQLLNFPLIDRSHWRLSVRIP
jgi:hypothetical protein